MKLSTLSYKSNELELDNISFEDVNLIVGKNAIGKSRTLAAIDFIAKAINQKSNLVPSQECSVIFKSIKGDTVKYEFRIYKNALTVHDESLSINGVTYLEREDSGKARIKNVLNNEFEVVYPPSTKLVIQTNRDTQKYPYFEELVLWAEQSFGFRFGSINPEKPYSKLEYNLLTSVDEIPELYKSLIDSDIFIEKKIISDLNTIGFDIDMIHLQKVENVKLDFLFIREQGIQNLIPFNYLSQGLFRSLSLLIFIEFLIAQRQPASIVIDDFCEGLDYERATKLGKLVFEKCLENNIQLITTSNDSFLMDVVELKYWNVLQRNGAVVTSVNIKSNPILFSDFKFTGLSNFDFFASDYIAQKNKA